MVHLAIARTRKNTLRMQHTIREISYVYSISSYLHGRGVEYD
jgi:hypothetical protein